MSRPSKSSAVWQPEDLRKAAGVSRDLTLLLLASVTAFFLLLGSPPATKSQELRVLETAREMDERGEYMVPYFRGNRRFEKPPLAYWLALAGYRLVGSVNEWSGRLYSAAAGTATVLLVYAFSRTLGRPRTGLWAGLILATSLLFVQSARRAEIDVLLTSATTAAIYAGWRALGDSSHAGSRSLLWVHLAWLAMATAVLAKGPAGLSFPFAVLAAYLACKRQWRDFRLLLYPSAVLLFLAVALPWFLVVAHKEDLSVDVFAREMNTAMGGVNHGKEGLVYAWFFYLIRVWYDFAPWSLLLVPAVASAIKHLSSERGFLLVWAGSILFLLEFVGNKQPHYFLPAFPALSLLVGWWLESKAPSLRFLPQRWPWACAATVVAISLLVTALLAVTGWEQRQKRSSCREFARTILPLVGNEPVYAYPRNIAAMDFYLGRVVALIPDHLKNADSASERFFLIAYGTEEDLSRPETASLLSSSRFLPVHTALPSEAPLRLYRSRLP